MDRASQVGQESKSGTRRKDVLDRGNKDRAEVSRTIASAHDKHLVPTEDHRVTGQPCREACRRLPRLRGDVENFHHVQGGGAVVQATRHHNILSIHKHSRRGAGGGHGRETLHPHLGSVVVRLDGSSAFPIHSTQSSDNDQLILDNGGGTEVLGEVGGGSPPASDVFNVRVEETFVGEAILSLPGAEVETPPQIMGTEGGATHALRQTAVSVPRESVLVHCGGRGLYLKGGGAL